MSDVIIRVENLGKKYKIRHQQQGRRYVALRDVIAEKAKGLFKKLKSSKTENPKLEDLSAFQNVSVSDFKKNVSVSGTEDFWALKDVSFEVKRGEVVGIIGRNGAGKSTLLKVLSRITEPTEGQVKLKGRVASLLEVGTGFHPELTGRENIFLNGAILGMHRAEIKRKFDEIVAFAEVEKFLDTPVKRYSSGMYVRLAFAVAAHLEPEILIVDEVLAVGDAEFQKKCLGKMQDVAKGGRTVLFVSHQLGVVRQLCQRVILLKAGSLVLDDLPPLVIDNYLSQAVQGVQGGCFVRNGVKPVDSVFYVNQVVLSDNLSEDVRTDFESDDTIVIRIYYIAERVVNGLYGYLTLQRSDGSLVYEGDSFDTVPNPFERMKPGAGAFSITIPKRLLAPGRYLIYLNFSAPQDIAGPNIDSPGTVGEFRVSDNHSRRGNRRQGFLSSMFDWQLGEP